MESGACGVLEVVERNVEKTGMDMEGVILLEVVTPRLMRVKL